MNFMHLRSLLTLIAFSGVLSFEKEDFIVQLTTGKIQGRLETATYSPFGNQTAHVYFGIPFAEPPLGNLRFRKTVPKKKWNGILETKKYKPACLSNATRTYKNTVGGPISEDCLYLNVFTNQFCMENKNCSVMLVVHGGMFIMESASAFNPQIMINNFVGQDRNIVVVTVNYRLGVFGFGQLNGQNSNSADKNVGMFDLVESLKWTNREISKFGGRPDRVTVAGHSAGGNIAFNLVSSPLSKGLVHQQVIMSAPMISNSKIGNTKATRNTAIRSGCLAENSSIGRLSEEEIKKAYDCMRSLDAETLLKSQFYTTANSTTCYGPMCVDGTVIADYPTLLLRNGKNAKVNTLIGTLTAELRDTVYLEDKEGISIPERVQQFCSHIGFRFAYTVPLKFEEICRKEYSKKSMAKYLSDDLEFYSPSINIANANLDKNTKVYVYSYSYSGAGLAFDKYMSDIESPSHSEDLIYVFGTHRTKSMQPKDYVIEKVYSGMIASFVNFADPSVYSNGSKILWEPYTKTNREYFNIDFDENLKMPGMKKGYEERANRIWNIEIPKESGEWLPMERFPPSFDDFICSNLAATIMSHLTQVSQDAERSLEVVEQGYYENDIFLKQLKMEYVIGNMSYEDVPISIFKRVLHFNELDLSADVVNGLELRGGEIKSEPINVILLIIAATLLIVMLYMAASRWLLYRKRSGYKLLN